MEDGSCFSLSRYGVCGNDKKVSVRQRETVFWEINFGFRKPSSQPGSDYQFEPWTLRILLIFSPLLFPNNILLWFLVIKIVSGIISELDWICFYCIISLAYTTQANVLADLIPGKKEDRLILNKQNGDQRNEKNTTFCCGRNRMGRNRRCLRAFIDKIVEMNFIF